MKGDSVYDPPDAGSFSYIIKVSSISPKQGSYLGGTELTILGENFSAATATDNNIFIEVGRDNVMCTVLSATATELKCVTPPAHPNFKLGDALTVTVQGRLVETAECIAQD